MAGISEIKEVLSFVFSLGRATALSLEDGDIGWSDAINFIEPIRKLGPALDHIEDVMMEVGDLDDDEFSELVDFVKSEYDLSGIIVDDYNIEIV